MGRAWSRRQVLISGVATARALAEGGRSVHFPSDRRRYPDPSTELEVFRLTDPAYRSTLAPYYNRSISRNGAFLIFGCDRGGTMQAFRMDLKSGESTQLTEAEAFDENTLALLPDNRSAVYFDARTLHVLPLATQRARPVYTVAEGWDRGTGVSVTSDGAAALLVEQQGGTSRVRSVGLLRGTASTVVEAGFAISNPIARPARAQTLYRQGAEALWLVNNDGAQNRRLKLAPGGIGPANWSADGRIVLYLRFPGEPGQLNEIREHTPDANTDKLVAKTSQFVHFGFNRDTSVFVGASRNAASPTVLLLLRVARREFTLCEHKASTAEMVEPMFSPDAQRIYFESDRHGKPAIYSMHVEKLVEKIEAES